MVGLSRLGMAVLGGLVLFGCTPAEDRTDHDPPPGQVGTGAPATQGVGGEDAPGTGGAGQGGEGGGIPPCEEWAGPFGSEPDDTLDPNLTWQGFAADSGEIGEVELGEYAACSGNVETRAIVVYVDALWCSVCRDVATDLAAKYEGDWRGRGIEVVTLVVEDSDGNPATVDSAWLWRQEYGLEGMAVLADPDYLLANGSPRTLPQALIVDPVTMRIVDRPIGRVDLDPLLDKFLAGNEEE